MKRNVAAFVTLAAIAGISVPAAVFANDSVSAEVRVNADAGRGERGEKHDERRMNLDARIGDMKARIEGRGDDMRATFASTSAEFKSSLNDRVMKHADHIYLSLAGALDRLASFETKVETRLDELADSGIDVSLSRDELAVAAGVRADAADNVADLEADLKVALDGDTSRSEIIALVRAARAELATVRKAYADVLVQIRADVKASKGD